MSQIDLGALGYVIVGIFVVTWALAVVVWRLARIEDRWRMRIPEQAPRVS